MDNKKEKMKVDLNIPVWQVPAETKHASGMRFLYNPLRCDLKSHKAADTF